MSSVRALRFREEDPEPHLADTSGISWSPVALTSFVGRQAEIAEILRLLDNQETRLLALTGPGGVGKTRIAIEVTKSVAADFADGVCFVPLASVRSPDEVLPAVAHELSIQVRDGRPLIDALVDRLRTWHLLLVLDNVEHLLGTPQSWLVDMLGQCPRIKVLVTSRVALNISGEHRYVIPPMAVPDENQAAGEEDSAAVALFTQRARAIRPNFALTPDNAHSVAAICRCLDGLPLAIELAAARIGAMAPREINARLIERSRLLDGGYRDAPRRFRSMRDAIAWGHDLLEPEVQRAFMQLAVCSGGFRIEAAGQVIDPAAGDAVDAVAALVDASLLQVASDGDDYRYVMLETIREFGVEQLAASGDLDAARHRHADWCLAMVREAGPADPVQDTTWFTRLEEERANQVAAMAWLDSSNRFDDLAYLLLGTKWLWYPPGRQAEGLAWFERLLDRYEAMPDTMHRAVLCEAGHLGQMLGRQDAVRYLDQALASANEAGDSRMQAAASLMLAIMAEDRGDYAAGETLFRTVRELDSRAGTEWALMTVDYHLGVVMYGSGRLAEAEELLDTTRAAAERFGEQLVPVWTRNVLALIACDRNDPERAAALLSQQPADFFAAYRHDLPVFLGAAGVLASVRGQFGSAARIFGAVARLETTMMLPERDAFERAAERARRSLGDEDWVTQFEIGRHMRSEEVETEVGRLLSGADSSTLDAPLEQRHVFDLTRREGEVLKLLADGLMNYEIAEALFLSRRTVDNHIDHIMAKLGARTRTAAVSFAIRNGLA